ncbi:MAG: hypothetical protein KDC24_07880 [Saprospiraceae bacterium]|nr:hypothetical protein [Saprospiraceae bacterium]
MLKGSFFVIATLLFIHFPDLNAQSDSIPNFNGDLKPMSSNVGVSDQTLIDILMPVMPGLGDAGRSLIVEQSVKPYLMPPREIGSKGDPAAYLLASMMEFYVNFDQNFKDNLSPDYISLNNINGQLEDAFQFLAETGTVSAAIMPYNAANISSAVFATQKYKIRHYLHIFGTVSKPRQKIFEIRKALTRGNPVLVHLKVDGGFQDIRGEKLWEPGSVQKTMTVPVLVVGFDQDNELLEIRSAWGRSWGNNGYIQVPYDTFSLYAEDGFVIVPEP